MPVPARTGASTASVRAAVEDPSGDAPAPWGNVVEPWIEERRRRLRRARRVSTLMLDLWGDAPPPPPDPALTAAQDALAADDGLGRAAHLVVQGDHLTYQQLGAVLALIEDGDRFAQALTMLPPSLRRRLTGAGHLSTRGGQP